MSKRSNLKRSTKLRNLKTADKMQLLDPKKVHKGQEAQRKQKTKEVYKAQREFRALKELKVQEKTRVKEESRARGDKLKPTKEFKRLWQRK